MSKKTGFSGCSVVMSALLLLFLVACGAVLIVPVDAARAGTITSCAGCHGMPPADAPYRNISTGRFVGSHDTHAWQRGNGDFNCGKCHKMPTANNHRNGNIDFVANINNSRLTARYKNVTSFPQSATPVFDTCANVNCHFETTTPQRGNEPLSRAVADMPQTCDTCHNSSVGSDNQHPKHTIYFGGSPDACKKCHPDHSAKANPFAHATSAGLRGIVFDFSAFPNNGGTGSYTGDTSYPLYLTNTNRNGTCSGLYCHSPGTKASNYDPPNRVPNWAITFGTSCIGCHLGDAESGSVMQTGSHAIHIGNGALTIIDCAKCHGATVTNSRTIKDRSMHLNKKVDISFDPAIGGTNGMYGGSPSPVAKNVGTAYGRCSNIYCHSNGTTTTPPFNSYSAVWGGNPFPADCTGCHGNDATSAKVLSTNNHRKHIDAGYNPGVGTAFGCVECHARTVSNNRTIIDKTKHVNTFKDYSGLRAGHISGGTCNTVYCHSSGQRSPAYRTMVPWSDTATTFDCKGCHGSYGTATLSLTPPAGNYVSQFGEPNYNNYSSADRNWFNSHKKHVATVSDCRKCHFNTVNDGNPSLALIAGTTLHVNEQKNVSFDTVVAGNNSPTYNDQTRRCSNVYCHSNGRTSGTVYVTPRWGGASIDCNFCHPIASLGGAHAIHVGGMIPTFYNYTGNHPVGSTYRFGCSNCHPLDKGTFHNNGRVNLALSNNAAGIGYLRSRNGATNDNGPNATGSGITGTSGISIKCTAVYCHSNGYTANLIYAATPDWYGGSFTGDRCANCHGNYPNSTIAGSPGHFDASNWLGSGKPGGHIVGIHYNNIYNGTTGLRTAGNSNTSSHGLATNSTTISCNVCHNDTVTVAYNDQSVNCSTIYCHDTGARLKGNAAIASAATHVNGLVDVKFAPVNVISKAQLRKPQGGWVRTGSYKAAGSYDTYSTSLSKATYTAGTKSCANVACHFQQTIKWGDIGGRTTCQSCHTSL
ncbi:CxxxxCH/CxxCH domain-containing protein [Geobacter sp.]|uniref:CxxxxCH/CxxCH domain c-type cytochrome n=1 Tax=Geobacter sp. TaxID=46610 RepID=UPI00262B40F7|nr:CxxxxCH/CxxCH domain-containing protein [Geobacter sp.]